MTKKFLICRDCNHEIELTDDLVDKIVHQLQLGGIGLRGETLQPPIDIVRDALATVLPSDER